MAIVVDPDNLDRDQVIFATNPQEISVYPVGSQVHANASSITATTSTGTTAFHDAPGTFVTWGVAPGDVIVLRNGPDAAHVIVSAVVNASTIECAADDGFTTFADGSALVYSIHDPSGGSIADGLTKQVLYSFAKEEWHTDAYATVLSDDLIKHEFPYEAITRESMEIGGGAAHADWVYFNDYTRKKIRTGGWADKNAAATASSEYAGIVTLGSLDTDTQVYYQQVSAQNTPVDFTFLGAVNEPILTYVSATVDYTGYLKLFARKKAKTYVQSEIADIGVATIEPIVNRFPLAHIDDAAITAVDAQVVGAAPFRTAASAVTATDGVASAITSTVGRFRSAGGTPFSASAVVAGDTLFITGTQTNAGYYTVTSVTNASTLQIDTTENGIWTAATTLDYDVFTIIRAANKAANVASALEDGATAAGASATVALFSATSGDFVTRGAAAGDILAIVSSTSDIEGVYVVASVVNGTTLQVDATDNPFGVTTGNDFILYTPGMFLQYKKEDITIAAHGSVVFDAINPAYASAPTIGRGTGSWSGDGVTEGTILVFASTASNNLAFTVVSTVNTSTVTCVPGDSARMTDETFLGASTTAYDAFKRTINNVVYGYNWKLTGNGATALNCYQFIQHQLRQPDDIDWGEGTSRGDVTDLLMAYATPTGTTTNLIIDDINADDTNNVTYGDATQASRSFPFVSSFTVNFNTNLQSDADAKFWMYYTTNPSGNYSTKDAVQVIDANGSAVVGTVGAAASKQFTYDYDGNSDGGRTPATDAAFTLVAIGKNTAQYVITTGTITRAKGLSFSMVSNLERNYSNP